MLLVPTKRAVVLKLRNPDRVGVLIPHHQRLDENTIAVRHGVEETRVLKNLGIEIPPPVLHYYSWPGRYRPYHHQRQTTAFLTTHARAFCFNDMGLGKTLSALWAADFLMDEGLVRRALILTTMSCMETVWQDEIFQNLMHRTSIIVHGSRTRRALAIQENVDFYILNHDGLRVPGVVDALLARKDIDLLIVDEASMLRNSRTKTYHSFQKLLQPQHRLWLLTGQPTPNGPEDAFGLGKLVAPSRLPQYFTRWQAETMVRLNQYKWAPKPDAMQKVYEALQPAIRYNKDDCLDLPPVVYLNRHAELSEDQKKAYRTMKEHLRITQQGQPVTAVNAAVKLSKLLQICCGAVHTDVDSYAALDTSPRLEVLKEIIDEAKAKVIVFVPYTGALRQVQTYLDDKGFPLVTVDGHITGGRRTTALNTFTRDSGCKVLVANPDTAAHGLNLSVADTMVWFSPIHSLETYRQACERMARPGQKNSMRIVHLGGTPLEWGVYKVLRGKDDRQQTLLDLYNQELKAAELI